MTIYGKSKRNTTRFKRELRIDLKAGGQAVQIYSIDYSVVGIKVAGIMLDLTPGEQVELVIEKDGGKVVFHGRVERDDGAHHVNRIGREANAFFIKILDEGFPDFVKEMFP
ncbi:MAG TPA: PilZ domain-containing protein [Nitrospirota bacterium]|nr:PilZ domain-containing protein [Nitrospirota bacterium]